jgi:hypothetical protein
MGFLDFLKTVAKGLTTAAGNIVPIVGPAAAAELNKQYRKGGMVMRKGGMVPAMAGGGLFGDMTSNIIAPMHTNPMTGKWEIDQSKMGTGMLNVWVLCMPKEVLCLLQWVR